MVAAAVAVGSSNKDIRINHTKAEGQQVAGVEEWDMDPEDRISTPITEVSAAVQFAWALG